MIQTEATEQVQQLISELKPLPIQPQLLNLYKNLREQVVLFQYDKLRRILAQFMTECEKSFRKQLPPTYFKIFAVCNMIQSKSDFVDVLIPALKQICQFDDEPIIIQQKPTIETTKSSPGEKPIIDKQQSKLRSHQIEATVDKVVNKVIEEFKQRASQKTTQESAPKTVLQKLSPERKKEIFKVKDKTGQPQQVKVTPQNIEPEDVLVEISDPVVENVIPAEPNQLKLSTNDKHQFRSPVVKTANSPQKYFEDEMLFHLSEQELVQKIETGIKSQALSRFSSERRRIEGISHILLRRMDVARQQLPMLADNCEDKYDMVLSLKRKKNLLMQIRVLRREKGQFRKEVSISLNSLVDYKHEVICYLSKCQRDTIFEKQLEKLHQIKMLKQIKLIVAKHRATFIANLIFRIVTNLKTDKLNKKKKYLALLSEAQHNSLIDWEQFQGETANKCQQLLGYSKIHLYMIRTMNDMTKKKYKTYLLLSKKKNNLIIIQKQHLFTTIQQPITNELQKLTYFQVVETLRQLRIELIRAEIAGVYKALEQELVELGDRQLESVQKLEALE